MTNKTKESEWVRYIIYMIPSSLLYAYAFVNFVEINGIYSGGVYGISQMIRDTLYQLGYHGNFEILGVIYTILNIPFFFLAYKGFGKKFVLRTMFYIVSYSVILTFIPITKTPLIADPIISTIVGGVLTGIAGGMCLSAGCCGGGLEILGMYMSAKSAKFSVGKLSMFVNSIIYIICAFTKNLTTAVLSIILLYIQSQIIDQMHTKNMQSRITVYVKNNVEEIANSIINSVDRDVTISTGTGGYTNEETNILVAIVSKNEIPVVIKRIKNIDAGAFIVVDNLVSVDGKFLKKLV